MILFFSSTTISLLINSFIIRFSEVSTSIQSTEDMHIFFPILIKVFSGMLSRVSSASAILICSTNSLPKESLEKFLNEINFYSNQI